MRHALPLFRYCPRCAMAAGDADDGRRFACPGCGFQYFHNTATATAALVTCDRHLLVTRRARPPGAGLLDVPGGFVEPGETALAALARELAEELGWNVLPGTPRYVCTQPNRYLYDGVEYATCDVFFRLELATRPLLRMDDEISACAWVPHAALQPADFAFASVIAALADL